jgi:hypothetical protein
MGLLVNGVCVADVTAANAARCGAYPQLGVTANGCYTYTTTCASSTAALLNLTRSSPAYTAVTGCSAQAATTLSFTVASTAANYPACDELLPYTDMKAIWLLGLAALAGIWAVKNLMARHVLGNH